MGDVTNAVSDDGEGKSSGGTVEVEAMPAPLLRSIVRAWVESYLPERRLAYAKRMDDEGHRFLKAFGKAA
ncbi:MAG: hypothetical protein F4089_10955 [Gammaproteobacteria bacterium]|nr:hypothetical protein [Gammaproteobacteria bacterium]